MKDNSNKLGRAATLALALLAANALASPKAPGTTAAAVAPQQVVIARVGDTVITAEEFGAAFNVAARNKFYHGKAPDGDVAVLQREVADQMVGRVLLLREAKARGIRPDASAIQNTIQGYDERYGNSEPWKSNRAKMLPPLVARLEEENLLLQIEQAVRAIPKPTVAEVRAYYAANPSKFTVPQQLRLSVILRRVPPSSPSTAWTKAFEQAQEISKRLQAGADFAAEARAHSDDPAAPQGGDMGFLHLGMLPEGTEAIVQALKVGETSNPMQILEGIALFKVTSRKEPKLNSFEAVQARAQDLLQRDRADQVWKSFVADLKKKTPSKIDQSRFMPLAEQAAARAPAK